MLAYEALEAGTRRGSSSFSTPIPTSSAPVARTGTTSSGWRPRARPAAARARSRPEPWQRLRLDEAPPGRLREPPRAGRDHARRRRPARSLGPRRRGHAPDRSALLGAPRGGRPARPRAAEPPGRRRARAARADRRARRDAAGGRPPRLLPAPRRLPGVAALRRPAGGARRGARLGGEERPRRGARAPRRARRPHRRRPLPRHAAHLGRGERARRLDPGARTSSAPT